MDGDGCDTKCKIEKYWRCTGGDTTKADNCVPTKRPIAQVHLYDGTNNKFRITFDNKVTLPASSLNTTVWELVDDKYSVTQVVTGTDDAGWPYADVEIDFGSSLINGTIEFAFDRS